MSSLEFYLSFSWSKLSVVGEREKERKIDLLFMHSSLFLICVLTGDGTHKLGALGQHSNQRSYLAKAQRLFNNAKARNGHLLCVVLLRGTMCRIFSLLPNQWKGHRIIGTIRNQDAITIKIVHHYKCLSFAKILMGSIFTFLHFGCAFLCFFFNCIFWRYFHIIAYRPTSFFWTFT